MTDMFAEASTEFELTSPPSDGVSSLSFSQGPDSYLLATSWDKTARIYDVSTNTERSKIDLDCPVLSGCMGTGTQAFGGLLDGKIKSFDTNAGSNEDMGTHHDAVRCLAFSDAHNVVVSGSWDKSVQVWDPRTRGHGSTSQATAPDKVYTMDTLGDKVVVATAGRHVWVYDIRNMSSPEQRRESSLKFQTRCVKIMSNGEGYVLSSIDGRVAVEWMDPSPEAQKRKYAFKCHRIKVDGQDTIYPINSVTFHPKYGTFATGGCDGIVNIWDAAKKKRLCQFHKYPTSISALAFSHDGTYLAVASSYTYEEGEKDHPADAIYIRRTTDEETKPSSQQ